MVFGLQNNNNNEGNGIIISIILPDMINIKRVLLRIAGRRRRWKYNGCRNKQNQER